MSSTTLVTLIHGVVAVSIVAAATVLLALHDVDSTTALALYGASLALVGGTTNTLLALRVPTATTPTASSAQPPSPPSP
jgi:hypothetical protein